MLATPNGCHEISIDVRAARDGAMQPVLRVLGQATPDGRLQVTVTNELTKQSQVIEV